LLFSASLFVCGIGLNLLAVFKKGIFVGQKSLLMQKTNKELKAMLVGVKRISSLNKNQLVNL
tara:strand:+ start:146 stop:331 length:186 start_codon:yes stop_codon:yes gene_type:complete